VSSRAKAWHSSGYAPSQWPHRQVEHEEGNADKNGHQHTSLLKRLADQQKPASCTTGIQMQINRARVQRRWFENQ
jgi:hypothetical protein